MVIKDKYEWSKEECKVVVIDFGKWVVSFMNFMLESHFPAVSKTGVSLLQH